MIRFGSVLEDLECYVDNSAIFDGNGNIVGRKGGIRQFLREEIPELAQRYKTVMKYKTLAKRFRQVLGVQDPVPASKLIEKEGVNKRYESCQKVRMKRDCEYWGGEREFVSERSIERGLGEDCAESTEKITGAIDVIVNTNSLGKGENNEDVKVVARKLLSECENTYMSVSAMITLMISPDYTPRLAPEAQRLRTLLAEAKYVPKGALAMLGA